MSASSCSALFIFDLSFCARSQFSNPIEQHRSTVTAYEYKPGKSDRRARFRPSPATPMHHWQSPAKNVDPGQRAVVDQIVAGFGFEESQSLQADYQGHQREGVAHSACSFFERRIKT